MNTTGIISDIVWFSKAFQSAYLECKENHSLLAAAHSNEISSLHLQAKDLKSEIEGWQSTAGLLLLIFGFICLCWLYSVLSKKGVKFPTWISRLLGQKENLVTNDVEVGLD